MSNLQRIYLSAPDITRVEEEALVRAIRSGWVAPLGPEVDAFEAELAEHCGREQAVALSSGTAALHLALLTSGVKQGDVVVTSTMTFAATANAIVYTGAEPVFIDSDESGNLDPDLMKEALFELERQGRRVAAILPVDLLGKVADHVRIQEAAERYGVPIVSDAAESVGATYRGRPAGSYGSVAALSFNGNKIMTTSGGGALLTDDDDTAARARYLASQARQPALHYEHTEIGYNYRLSNVLAAIGRAQLSRLDSMMARRQEIRSFYADLAANLPGISIFGEPSSSIGDGTFDNCWLTAIQIDPEVIPFSVRQLNEILLGQDIEARPIWKPMHLQPVFQEKTAFVNGTSEKLYQECLTLPSGSKLTNHDLERVADAIQQAYLSLVHRGENE